MSSGDSMGHLQPMAITHSGSCHSGRISASTLPRPTVDPNMMALDSPMARTHARETTKSSQVGFLTSHSLLNRRMAKKTVARHRMAHVTVIAVKAILYGQHCERFAHASRLEPHR